MDSLCFIYNMICLYKKNCFVLHLSELNLCFIIISIIIS